MADNHKGRPTRRSAQWLGKPCSCRLRKDFGAAGGEGLEKPARDDIKTRVLELMDPKAAADREQKKAEKAAKAGPSV